MSGSLTCRRLSSADSAPTSSRRGRVRGATLPHEYALAQFIQGIENPHPSWTPSNPAEEWSGVECNKRGEVVAIRWGGRRLRGCVQWRSLPPTLRTLLLPSNALTGTLETQELPPELQIFSVSQNQLSGVPDMTRLPDTLEVACLSSNLFEGEVKLNALPGTLRTLVMSNMRKLRGEVYYAELPCPLRDYISVSGTSIRVLPERK